MQYWTIIGKRIRKKKGLEIIFRGINCISYHIISPRTAAHSLIAPLKNPHPNPIPKFDTTATYGNERVIGPYPIPTRRSKLLRNPLSTHLWPRNTRYLKSISSPSEKAPSNFLPSLPFHEPSTDFPPLHPRNDQTATRDSQTRQHNYTTGTRQSSQIIARQENGRSGTRLA